eukprot:2932650-Karenia_brevis.AAC.1
MFLKQKSEVGKSLLVNDKTFRARFAETIAELGLSGHGFLPYSLRRGGASFLYLRTGNLSLVQQRGRWQNLQNAEIYVDECVAVSHELRLDNPVQVRLKHHEE